MMIEQKRRSVFQSIHRGYTGDVGSIGNGCIDDSGAGIHGNLGVGWWYLPRQRWPAVLWFLLFENVRILEAAVKKVPPGAAF